MIKGGHIMSAALCASLSLGGSAPGLAQKAESSEPPQGRFMQELTDWQSCFSRSPTQDRAAALAACERLYESQKSLSPELFHYVRNRLDRRRQTIAGEENRASPPTTVEPTRK